MIETFGEYREFTIKCDNPKCSNYLVVVEREKKFPEKKHYFCCKHCSHSFSGGCVNPNNIKAGRKKFDEEHPGYWSKNGIINEKIIRNCLWCGIIFETNTNVSKLPLIVFSYTFLLIILFKYKCKKYTDARKKSHTCFMWEIF